MGAVEVRHISEKWRLTVEADKIAWSSSVVPAACYPRADSLSLLLIGNEGARLFENEIGLMTLEVYRYGGA